MENHIGIKLCKLRKSGGYRQKEIAAMLGIKTSTYSAYEELRANPPLETIYLICMFYNVTFEQLMGPQSVPNKFSIKI